MAIIGLTPARIANPEARIGAEPDEGLLADADEAAIARQQVPALRQRDHREQEEQVLQE
jgi:hypothetical protein